MQALRHAFDILKSLNHVGYYWGSISYGFAENLLKNKMNDSFLVRDSKHDNYLLTITFVEQNDRFIGLTIGCNRRIKERSIIYILSSYLYSSKLKCY